MATKTLTQYNEGGNALIHYSINIMNIATKMFKPLCGQDVAAEGLFT
jgi:hypothetical protein